MINPSSMRMDFLRLEKDYFLIKLGIPFYLVLYSSLDYFLNDFGNYPRKSATSIEKIAHSLFKMIKEYSCRVYTKYQLSVFVRIIRIVYGLSTDCYCYNENNQPDNKKGGIKMRIMTIYLLLIFTLMNGQANAVFASENDYSSIKPIVKKAFDTQVQLSEKERSLKEIRVLMNQYFTSQFIPKFLKENLVKTEKGYQAIGTDFPLYYVPFFSYDENTKVIVNGNESYVVEKINHEQEGPVQYGEDYKGVRLVKEKQTWKIEEVLTKVPSNIIEQIKIGTDVQLEVNHYQFFIPFFESFYPLYV